MSTTPVDIDSLLLDYVGKIVHLCRNAVDGVFDEAPLKEGELNLKQAVLSWHKQQAYKEVLQIINQNHAIYITTNDISLGEDVAKHWDALREKQRQAAATLYGERE